jgi:Permuted papain-like amidase enzyme, YaeF/YiiX, C92 family
MKRLREEELAFGDIILTTTKKLDSKVIRGATKSDISHAMVYVDPCCVIDATGEGVHARNTQRMFFAEDCAVHVLRPKIPLRQPEIEAICTFVRARVGTEYSTREAVATIIGGLDSWSRKQFCSRLVAQAYASIGRDLVPDQNFCSPEDIKSSAMLAEVANATSIVTDHEVEKWERDPDMTKVTRGTINAVLDRIREKNKEIQSMNDVDVHLIEHPEDDDYFCEVLQSSGYLTMWHPEMRKNPWQYDVSELTAIGWDDEEIESYCHTVLATAKNGGKRYHLNKAGYLYLSQQHGLRSFELLGSLYQILADLDMQRFQVAQQWLNARSPKAKVDPYVAPHSPEWFAALDQWQPYQAIATRVIIEREGRLDVCSACGDDPAPIYKVEGTPPPGSVATLRLCSDCHEIRKMMGEDFVPL